MKKFLLKLFCNYKSPQPMSIDKIVNGYLVNGVMFCKTLKEAKTELYKTINKYYN